MKNRNEIVKAVKLSLMMLQVNFNRIAIANNKANLIPTIEENTNTNT